MIYITGDTHGYFNHIVKLCEDFNMTTEDKLIILGDVGLNYFINIRDKKQKVLLSRLPLTFICIHGNHEERPQNIPSYELTTNENGIFYYEPAYPNILFCIDGEKYEFNGKTYLCLGGAYSIDKHYRLNNGLAWFKSEQMSGDAKQEIEHKWFGRQFDYILAHTCPHRYMPKEAFLSGVNQSNVDNSMEEFLDKCYSNIESKQWFCGHWHINKLIDNIRFLANDIITIY